MQLSLHADYSLRVLLYLGTHPDQVVTTRDISDAYGISKHHLVRVAQTLGEHGYVELIPGRSGGLRLAMDPAAIRLGDVVRRTEPHLRLVECFDVATNTCPITTMPSGANCTSMLTTLSDRRNVGEEMPDIATSATKKR